MGADSTISGRNNEAVDSLEKDEALRKSLTQSGFLLVVGNPA
jgi:hypothetical protein